MRLLNVVRYSAKQAQATHLRLRVSYSFVGVRFDNLFILAIKSSFWNTSMTMLALIIDDDPDRIEEIQFHLKNIGNWQVATSSYAESEQKLKDSRTLRVAFLGYCKDTQQFEQSIQVIKQRDADLPIVAVFDQKPDTESIAPFHELCCSIINRPLHPEQLQQTLTEVNTWRRRRRQTQPRRPLELFRSLSGSSEAVNGITKLIYRVAPTDATVLVTGPSGTGKEVVARKIHYFSARRDKPFVPVNCGAIPDTLLESELFGYEKGAFTGAITSRQGRFELAQGGTLFLDEIGDMPLIMQVKLLRVLQERVFERIGSNKVITADVRIVAATHRDLESMISNGDFREDLYYRLNVFPIDIPPLRDRVEDLPDLVRDLLARIRHEQDVEFSLAPDVINCLSRYEWPGNIRELANLMERLAILYPGQEVEVGDLPAKFRNPGAPLLGNTLPAAPVESNTTVNGSSAISLPEEGLDLKQYLTDIESRFIYAALDRADGVVAQAAELLHMRRTTLVEKMRKYQISRPNETAAP